MKNKLIVKNVCVGDNKIEYTCSIEGEWKQAFRTDETFFIEYSQDFNREIPYGVAIIPLLGNFLPISWVFDAEIVIEEIDMDYLSSIDEIKRGYQWMYPQIEFRGKLTYGNAVAYDIEEDSEKCALYFSGGVDAFSSLVSVIKEKPILLTVWGTDVFLKDVEGWEKISENTKNVANQFDLDYIFIKTSFRNVVNYTYLNNTIGKPNHENWWHGFQHAIALITHSAPLAYALGIRRIHFSSTDSVKSSGIYTCASHPAMDFNERFCGCRTIHEGFENTRQDKVRKICNYFARIQKPIKLHVCWVTRNGENCCQCEKCARTIFGILGEGYDPNDWGFELNEEKYNNFIELIKSKKIILYPVFWEGIVKGLMNRPDVLRENKAAKYIVGELIDKIENRSTFHSTIFNKVNTMSIAQSYEDTSNIVMFRRNMNTDNIAAKFENVGMNTGNMVFTKALEKELDLDIMSVDECSGKMPKHIITTDLIWITPQSDYNYLIDQMNRFKDSVYVPISVGLQAQNTDVDFKLNNSTLKVLQMIQEKAVIGCRGEYTASILEKNNIHNIEVIGCPSVYIRGDKDYNISNNIKDYTKIMCNFRTFFGHLSKKEKHFLSYCTTKKFDFVEQTKYHLTLESVDKDEKYYNYVNKWLEKKTYTFFDIDEWSSFAALHDFSIGARFHGNIVALWNNVPALFMPIDSRTQELIDFFKFPYIHMEEFDWEKPIEYYFEKADYSEFNRTYLQKYNSFVSFLKKNGISI